MTFRQLARWAASLAGAVMLVAALLAEQIGLDSNGDWGPSRRLLFGMGGVLLIAGWGMARLPGVIAAARRAEQRLRGVVGQWMGRSWLGRLAASIRQSWIRSPTAGRLLEIRRSTEREWLELLSRSRFLAGLAGTRQARAVSAGWAAFGLVAISYLWYVTVGTWSQWPSPSAYYDLQAEAFLHGQTALVEQPSANLLALANPYDPDARATTPHLWDASLYNGRYYLYWGPVPALMLVPLKAIVDVRVGDDVLIFLFSVCSLFWITRLITRAWGDFYSATPGWTVPAVVMVAGWANPATWLLNSPWIYETSIVGGQLFVLMSLNACYPLLARGKVRLGNLAWAGVSGAMAVGTRWSLAVAVGVLSVFVLLLLRLVRPGRRRMFVSASSFLAPLFLAALALGIYNYVRFGSPFETGHTYQLTSLDLHQASLASSSFHNVLPNLYNYLVNPARLLPVFPYLKPRWGGVGMSVFRIRTPPLYYSRQITGLVETSPFFVFSLAALGALWARRGRLAGTAGWLTASVFGMAAAEFAIIVLYVVASMRYVGDFGPLLMVGSGLGLWETLATQAKARSVSGILLLSILALMTWTILAGLLLGITSYHARFEILNPALFHRLTEWFTL